MKKNYFSLFDYTIMAMVGALCAVLKIALKMPIKMPGHNGVFVAAVILVGALIIRKKGSALITGAFGAAIIAFTSSGKDGPIVAFVAYIALALGMEAGLLLFRAYKHPNIMLAFITAALFGAWSKLLVKASFDIIVGLPLAVVLTKSGYAFFTYSLFGFLGGTLGYFIVQALECSGLNHYLQDRK
ncbi:MAG: ECF transporter S component [Fibrobacteria bacterium]|nr:ECF transporter S component [Fibrobacteria bacterium]